MTAEPTDQSAPVTTIVTRRVRSERREDYETWLHQFIEDAAGIDGFLGADVHPPAPDTEPIYRSVFRFSDIDHLERFERSDFRRAKLDEVADLVDGDATWDSHTGLEFWFAPPPGTVVPQPVRWRMAVLLGVVVYLLVLVFGAAAGAVMGDVPFALRLAVVIAVEITLMTYVILPTLTRRLATWIYPTQAKA